MSLTLREFWTAFHGILAGAVFLLNFSGALIGLLNMKQNQMTERGLAQEVRRMVALLWLMAVISWITVISGTYLIYPWYRGQEPTSARSILMASPAKAPWHTFGMEWKEHVGWFSPILATAVAALVWRYRKELALRDDVRRAAIVLCCMAFITAVVSGLLGAFINKAAPMH
jgi:hypothetical protein